jgi:hypothetical protein
MMKKKILGIADAQRFFVRVHPQAWPPSGV